MQISFGRLAQFLFLVLTALIVVATAEAQTYIYTTLYSFKNNGTDPSMPGSYLTVDAAGNLYGTSSRGGKYGEGTVFKISKVGAVTVLHSFKGSPSDGARPGGNVLRDSAGNLYGTTNQGGNSTNCRGGCGTVFQLTPSGVETVLYNFSGGADGFAPGEVVIDFAKNIYGLSAGGVNAQVAGVLFELDNTNAFHVLYSFCSLPRCEDGQNATGSIVRDSAGNIYGATSSGGSAAQGTVYKVTPAGVETVLHNFTSLSDGSEPFGGVIQDNNGNLYGGAAFGGSIFGTLFKIPESGGPETTLYTFCSLPNCSDGAGPMGRVQRDSAGNLYGTTFETAKTGSGGVVWKVDTSGQETVLFQFGSKVIGDGGLTIDSKGNLYGCTVNGGPSHHGSVFKLTPN
jgi:uncharacterized repeat protein (TIGR03803 family)